MYTSGIMTEMASPTLPATQSIVSSAQSSDETDRTYCQELILSKCLLITSHLASCDRKKATENLGKGKVMSLSLMGVCEITLSTIIMQEVLQRMGKAMFGGFLIGKWSLSVSVLSYFFPRRGGEAPYHVRWLCPRHLALKGGPLERLVFGRCCRKREYEGCTVKRNQNLD